MADREVTLYVNPACSKCRAAVALLDARDVPYRVRDLVAQPLGRDEATALLHKLGSDDPRTLMRTKEPRYQELGLLAAHGDELLDALVGNPELVERPIAVLGGRALIARPPERVLDLLASD